MSKPRDRVVVTWIENDVQFDEELIFANEDDSDQDIQQKSLVSIRLEEDASIIDNFEYQMVQICMHDCLEKISILKCISQRGLAPLDFQFPEYKTIEQRFGDNIKYGTEVFTEEKKRYLDLAMTYGVLYKTLESLSVKRSIAPLIEGTAILKLLRDEEEALFYDQENSVTLEHEVKQKLNHQAKILDAKYKEKLREVRRLEVQYEDVIGYGILENKYIKNWEAARQHQFQIILENEGNNFQNIIDGSQVKMILENTVHNDIVRFIEESVDEMQIEIQYWVEHYDKEIEYRDSEIIRLKIEREAQEEKFEALKAEYEEHKEFIEYWEAYKKAKKEREELEAMQTKGALKIQCWWRAVMQQKGLLVKKKDKKKGKKK